MKHLLIACLLASASFTVADLIPAAKTTAMLEGAEWTPIFDGKSLTGWKGEEIGRAHV